MFGKTLPPSEKWKAIGAFGAIAGVSAVAFDLMLFGGFQIDPAPQRVSQAQPAAQQHYSDMIDGAWRSAYSTISTAWSDAREIDPELSTETLAGDAASAPEQYLDAIYSVPSEDELYEEISALYAEQDRHAADLAEDRAMADAEAVSDDYFVDDDMAADKSAASDNPEPVTAYESASPW